MILHLGGDVVVPLKDVISIHDISISPLSDINREFLQVAKEEGFVREISEGEHKSFILTEIDKRTVIFLSPISSATLLKRSTVAYK